MDTGGRDLTPREMQQYVWHYFELHANQRMSVFRFFIGLATFLTASLLTASVQNHHFAGAVLGALLTIVSFVFCKLDERTCFLIEMSEGALIELEERFLGGDTKAICVVQLFKTEKATTEKKKGAFATYRQCLKWLFAAFGSIGFITAAISVCKIMS